jgi:hypothetical protein
VGRGHHLSDAHAVIVTPTLSWPGKCSIGNLSDESSFAIAATIYVTFSGRSVRTTCGNPLSVGSLISVT